MTLDDIKRLDPKGMYAWVRQFPDQMQEAVSIGRAASLGKKPSGITTIVLTGLGGSAIGGDLLRTYLAGQLTVPFLVNRGYALPAYVGKDTLVIVSSYSGNTEETIASYKDAIRKKAKVLAITTGGTIGAMAAKRKDTRITIPPGLSPRAAVGYSFFPLLVALARLGFVKSQDAAIKETQALMRTLAARWSDPTAADNLPYHLATKFRGMLPVIYSNADQLEAVNVRWRGQINENAKQLAHGHVLPEMNHNELVGWRMMPDLMKRMHVAFLKDADTHPRVAIREQITEKWISPLTGGVTIVQSEGKSMLARMFSLIHFGDWVSLYLAIQNGVDPEPVEPINYLKGELAKVR